MNYKSFLQIFVILFLLCLSLGTSLIQIRTLKNEKTNNIDNFFPYTVKEDLVREICHHGFSTQAFDGKNTNISDIENMKHWIMPNELFLFYSTQNQLNYTEFIKPYNNSFLEIWHTKECFSQNLFILREKVIKIVENFKPCPEEPDFFFQTHIYCMIKNFMIQSFSNGEVTNCFSELTKITNLFFLAQKNHMNIVSRLVIECDYLQNLVNYDLSVIRIPKKRKEQLYDSNWTRKEIKNDVYYSNNTEMKNRIKNFDIERYKCDIIFYVHENNNDDWFLNILHFFYSEKKKEQNPINNNTLIVILSENEIINDVNTAFNILSAINITDSVSFLKIFNDDKSNEQFQSPQDNLTVNTISIVNESTQNSDIPNQDISFNNKLKEELSLENLEIPN